MNIHYVIYFGLTLFIGIALVFLVIDLIDAEVKTYTVYTLDGDVEICTDLRYYQDTIGCSNGLIPHSAIKKIEVSTYGIREIQ